MNHIYTKDNENLEIEISKLLKLETSESLRCLILELLDENLKSIQFYCKDLEEIALADAKVKAKIEGKTVRKVIAVPGRLVNIVAN